MGNIANTIGGNHPVPQIDVDVNDNTVDYVAAVGYPGINGLVMVNPDGSFIQGSGFAIPQANLMGNQTFRDTTTLPATGNQNLFTVNGGRVLITNVVATVTTVIQAQANAIQLVATPTAGTAVNLDDGTVDTNALQAGGHISWSGVFGATAVKTNAGEATGMLSGGATLMGPGTLSYTTAATNTGSIKWCVSWLPLDPGATVTVTGMTGSNAWLPASQAAALLQAQFGYWTEGVAHTLPASGAGTYFTITGGDVYIKHMYSEVTTAVQNQACTIKFTATPIAGSNVDLFSAVSIANKEVGAHVTNPTGPGNVGVVFNAGAAELIDPHILIIPQGTITATTSATNTGAMKYGAFWVPKDAGATLVAN